MKSVYRIYDKHINEYVSVYMNVMAHDKEYFHSPEAARNSNCHGIYANAERYSVREFVLVPRDTYEDLLKSAC